MSSVKTLFTGLLLGCLAVGTYAALENGSPAVAGGPIAAHSESPASPSSPHESERSAAGETIGGTVLEVIQVPSYTYLRLQRSEADELWVAVSKAEVKEGQTVKVTRAERMENFSSKQLGRTFSVIYFGNLGSEGVAATEAGAHSEANPHAAPPGSRSDRGTLADMVKIVPGAKAEGESGHKIGEIFSKKDKLRGSKVRVRGTVVALTMNVMGTNFVHIRDGSGAVEKRTHDLVLKVAQTPPNVGEQALFEGTVQVDVDLGAGYTYSALLEEATVIGM